MYKSHFSVTELTAETKECCDRCVSHPPLASRADANKTSIFCFRKYVRNFHPQSSLTPTPVIWEGLRTTSGLRVKDSFLFQTDSPTQPCTLIPKDHLFSSLTARVFQASSYFLSFTCLLIHDCSLGFHWSPYSSHSHGFIFTTHLFSSYALNQLPTQAFNLALRSGNLSHHAYVQDPHEVLKS